MGVMREDEEEEGDVTEYALAYDIPAPWRVVESQRAVGDGSERELRRRRREAVVVHDGEWPLERAAPTPDSTYGFER
jgi:hypothetical protein